jgi:nitric oxide reductase NorE protein
MTPGTNLFFMYYYVMTGLHLCHVLLGLVILCFVIRNLADRETPNVIRGNRRHLLAHGRRLVAVLFALLYVMR